MLQHAHAGHDAPGPGGDHHRDPDEHEGQRELPAVDGESGLELPFGTKKTAAANPKTHLDAWRMWAAHLAIKNEEDRIPAE